MTKTNAVQDLTDDESQQLWTKLNEVIHLSDQMASNESDHRAHRIYKLARDCRDLLVFDQHSREVMRKLTQQESYGGLVLTDTVKTLARTNRKIEAIKELRTATGCGLKEAKDAVEAYMAKQGIGTW
jgi:bifunctional N-acetylglucosamine-1-phosphate-uridyltransferase/glucosamine-1-phosphate-acetyltransferase GlmU-like protein